MGVMGYGKPCRARTIAQGYKGLPPVQSVVFVDSGNDKDIMADYFVRMLLDA